ncbi:MAG: hypothetical protein AAB867_00630 [Patescibacteria group bacterium]
MMGGERIKLRGKYNPTNWKRKYPNLQYAKVAGQRTLVCTNCIKKIVSAGGGSSLGRKAAVKKAPAKKVPAKKAA